MTMPKLSDAPLASLLDPEGSLKRAVRSSRGPRTDGCSHCALPTLGAPSAHSLMLYVAALGR